MMLVQRSGDMLTASGPGGINEIQYAAFLMMIAAHTGYTPGVFTHVVANEQIYDRHINVAYEMLRRYDEFYPEGSQIKAPNPSLFLNTDRTRNFFEFTIDDFTMFAYNPIKPQLILELGI
jgi:thymidylate synthase